MDHDRITPALNLREWLQALAEQTQGNSPYARLQHEDRWMDLTTGYHCRSTSLAVWFDELLTSQAVLSSQTSSTAVGFAAHIRVCKALTDAGYNVDYYLGDIARRVGTDATAEQYSFSQFIAEVRFVLQAKAGQTTAAAATFQGKKDENNKPKSKKNSKAGDCEIHTQPSEGNKHSTKECRLLKRGFQGLSLDKCSQDLRDKISTWLQVNSLKATQWWGKPPGDSKPDEPMITTLGSMSNFDIANAVILDSGATEHICNNWSRFLPTSTVKLDPPYQVTSGGRTITLDYKGTMIVEVTKEDGSSGQLHAQNAYFWPQLHTSLLSQTIMMERGWTSKNPLIWQNGNNNITLTVKNRLLVADLGTNFHKEAGTIATVAASMRNLDLTAPIDLWHQRLGHPNPSSEQEMLNKSQICLPRNSATTVKCDVCEQAKAKRREWTNPQPTRYSAPFAHTCWDLFKMGPALGRPATSMSTRICAATGMVFIGTPPSKNERDLSNEVRHFDLFLQRRYELLLRCWQSDNEPGLPIRSYMEDYGIDAILTSPYTPHENGKAERIGGAIKQLMTAIFISTGFPQELWPWIANLAAYMFNRQPKAKHSGKSPWQVFNEWLKQNKPAIFAGINTGPPNLSHMRVPGCRAYACTTKLLQGKKEITQPKAHIGYFIGYKSSTQYWIWIPQLRRVINTPHVRFDEARLFKDDKMPIPVELLVADFRTAVEALHEALQDDSNNQTDPVHQQFGSALELYGEDTTIPQGSVPFSPWKPVEKERILADTQDHGLLTPEGTPEPAQPPMTTPAAVPTMPTSRLEPVSADLDVRHIITGKREPKPRNFMTALITAITALMEEEDSPEPRNVAEARRHKYAPKWRIAEQNELTKIKENGTYEELAEKPPGDPEILGLMWVYKYKDEGEERDFKARLCVRGDQQEESILSVYAATLSAVTYRCLLAIANKFFLHIVQYDAVSAFTNAPLDEVVYTRLPPGYGKPGHVWLLRRALYGLRRSPLLWYRLLREACENLGLTALTQDPCVLTDGRVTVFFHVDDINFMYHPRDENRAKEITSGLESRFALTGGDPISNFLKIRVTRHYDERHLYLDQQAYVENVTMKFGVSEGDHLPTTPLPSAKLPPRDHGHTASKIEQRAYLKVVGSIIYATYMTRPDAAFAISFLAQFLPNPAPEHQAAAIHLLGYLLGTKELALHFDGESDELLAFADASFADHPDRTSSQGYIFTLFGGPIAWKASKQSFVSLSSTEAELRAASTAAQNLVATNRLLEQLGLQLDQMLSLCCDNLQTVRLLNNEAANLVTRIRHIDIHRVLRSELVIAPEHQSE